VLVRMSRRRSVHRSSRVWQARPHGVPRHPGLQQIGERLPTRRVCARFGVSTCGPNLAPVRPGVEAQSCLRCRQACLTLHLICAAAMARMEAPIFYHMSCVAPCQAVLMRCCCPRAQLRPCLYARSGFSSRFMKLSHHHRLAADKERLFRPPTHTVRGVATLVM